MVKSPGQACTTAGAGIGTELRQRDAAEAGGKTDRPHFAGFAAGAADDVVGSQTAFAENRLQGPGGLAVDADQSGITTDAQAFAAESAAIGSMSWCEIGFGKTAAALDQQMGRANIDTGSATRAAFKEFGLGQRPWRAYGIVSTITTDTEKCAA